MTASGFFRLDEAVSNVAQWLSACHFGGRPAADEYLQHPGYWGVRTAGR